MLNSARKKMLERIRAMMSTEGRTEADRTAKSHRLDCVFILVEIK